MTHLTSVPLDHVRSNVEWRFEFSESELKRRDRTNRLIGAVNGVIYGWLFVLAFWAMGGFR